MELDILGRILPQVEQARVQFSAATRLRVDHHFVPVLALPRYVRHLSPLRCGARTRHGCGYQKDPVRLTSLTPSLLPSLCAISLTTKYGRMYLFAMQLIQIPLIAVGRTSVIKRNNLLGNTVFWLGLYAGFPLLCVAYVLY